MTVPEALDALDRLVLMSHPSNRQDIEDILDAVWLTAYEEGIDRVFESPDGNNVHGKHERASKLRGEPDE